MKTVALTTDELNKCLTAMIAKKRPQWKAWAALMATEFVLGSRVSECLALRRSDLLDDNGGIRSEVTRKKLKTGKKTSTISVPIDCNSDAAKIIMRWLDWQRINQGKFRADDYVFSWGYANKPIFRTATNRAFGKIYRELGLNGIPRGNHAIRKSAGCFRMRVYSATFGNDWQAARATQKFFGHSNIATTEAYLPQIGEDSPEIAKKHGDAIRLELK